MILFIKENFIYNNKITLVETFRRDAGVAYLARLESVCTFTGTVGSNPTLSASIFDDVLVAILSNNRIFSTPYPTQIHPVLPPYGDIVETFW